LQKDKIDLKEVKDFFEKQNWQVHHLIQPHRNIYAFLTKNNQAFHLKLAGSKGMSLLLENEAEWNKQFNQLLTRDSQFWVPKNVAQGWFNHDYFYLITEQFTGRLLVNYPQTQGVSLLTQQLDAVIDMSEVISSLDLDLRNRDYASSGSAVDFFLIKTHKWFKAIPTAVAQRYQLSQLLRSVETEASALSRRARHGDFTPWHIFLLNNHKLALIDAEHATSEGVEYYDIAYFIQRVYQVLKSPALAKTIYQKLVDRGYDIGKLKTILAARAIGGFLDESLIDQADYIWARKFKEWVNSIKV